MNMTDTAAVGREWQMPSLLADEIERALAGALEQDWVARLWSRDTSLWSADPNVTRSIEDRLGWLDLPAAFSERVEVLEAFATGVIEEGFTSALVCGMGGSSLAPEVLASSLPRGAGGIPVQVLDSTDPTAVRLATSAADPAQTLYLIASKSGTTTETLALLAHLWHVADEIHNDIPQGLAGRHFVAITDPSPSVDAIPHVDLFRETFLNPATVGGRYSALSYVGLVPAALLGLDLRALLDDARAMAASCRTKTADNPGLSLGVALATLARGGRDKLTLLIEPRYASLGAWIEQLVAESTGKRGQGVVPIDREPIGDPGAYGEDRAFVRIAAPDSDWWAETDSLVASLARAGHPLIDLTMAAGPGALGAEFFRWEFATAICGVALGINPFDEPNVTESKDNTRRVLEQFRETGSLPADEPLAGEGPLTLIGDSALRLTAGHDGLANELRRHVTRVPARGYLALHAYFATTPERDAILRNIARLLRDRTRRAVTVGYGPRFLHSTGQLHKGGAPIGCFLQLTAEHADDLPIHGWRESFGTLIDAQAAGDFMALEAHELPVARVRMAADPEAGLITLRDIVAAALEQPLKP